MEIVTVGTGSCTPRLERLGPSTLLTFGRLRVAVDLGLGSLHGLLRAGVFALQTQFLAQGLQLLPQLLELSFQLQAAAARRTQFLFRLLAPAGFNVQRLMQGF